MLYRLSLLNVWKIYLHMHFMYMGVLSACMSRREHQIPWDYSYRWLWIAMWVLRIDLKTSESRWYIYLLNHLSSLFSFFIFRYLILMCMSVCLSVCICTMCMLEPTEIRRGVRSYTIGVIAVNCHLSAGNWTASSIRASALNHWATSTLPQPRLA